MGYSRISERYAKSLIQLAKENQELDKAFEDMLLVGQACKDSREFSLVLNNPIIKTDKKLRIIERIFTGKVAANTLSFLKLITRKKRESYLEYIADAFIDQYRELKGIKKATVTSPVPLSDEARQKLLNIIKQGKDLKVELEEKIDQSLIGGFVLRMDDKQLDTSIATSINRLKQELMNNTARNN